MTICPKCKKEIYEAHRVEFCEKAEINNNDSSKLKKVDCIWNLSKPSKIKCPHCNKTIKIKE